MKTQAFIRVAVLPFALACGAATAQQEPVTRIDTAPVPAEERGSVGSIELMNEPVIAKRRYLEQLARSGAAPDTRSMGAGPARVLRRLEAGDAMRLQRALDAAEQRSSDPIAP